MAGTSEVRIAPSFEELLTPLLGPAYRLAASIGDRSDAEDVVQEAALLAFRAFNTFAPGTNFRAWFFRIVTNCSYARHRTSTRRPHTVEFDDVPDLYLYTMTQDNGTYADTHDPAGAVLGRMTVDQILAAIQMLPDEYRTAAALYFVDDQTYEEIAAALRLPRRHSALAAAPRPQAAAKSAVGSGAGTLMSDLTAYDCDATFRRLNDYLDRRLPADERRLVEAHLADCVVCAREYRFEQNVLDNVRGALSRLDVPPDLSRKVAEQLDAAREQKP